MFLGPEVLREVIENAELYPIKGLFNFRDFSAEIDSYYYQTLGYQLGVSTGWRALNELYNVGIILILKYSIFLLTCNFLFPSRIRM